jgi:hypothetical protein
LHIVAWQHRGRRRSIGYIARYAAEFVLGRRAPAWASAFDSWYVTVNLFDTMYVALRRA